MKPTQALHDAGQSIWLDNITRALIDEGTLDSARDGCAQEPLPAARRAGGAGPADDAGRQ